MERFLPGDPAVSVGGCPEPKRGRLVGGLWEASVVISASALVWGSGRWPFLPERDK
jgi:hypothetical protein